MEQKSYSEQVNGEHGKFLIKSSGLLVIFDQQDLVEPIQESEVEYCDWVEDGHTS